MATRVEDLVGPHLWRGRAACSAQAVLATGFDALDEALGGGWPWGALIEIFAPTYGSGELSVLTPALASLPEDDAAADWIVWVSPPLVPYAPALIHHAVDVARILIVQAAEETLWATEQALSSGASAAVLAWLPAASDTALRRLQLAAEERCCGLVLFRPERALSQRSPAALRMKVSPQGAQTRIDVLKRRGGRPCSLTLDLSAASRRGAQAGEHECR